MPVLKADMSLDPVKTSKEEGVVAPAGEVTTKGKDDDIDSTGKGNVDQEVGDGTALETHHQGNDRAKRQKR